MPKDATRIMKQLPALAWLCWMLTSCTAGMDYRRPLSSWVDFNVITTGKDYQRVLDSWLGYNIASLVKRWGYPTNVFELPDGNTIYAFNRFDESESVLAKNEVPSITSQICAGTTSLCLDKIQRRSRLLLNNIEPTPFRSKNGFTYLPEYIALAYDNEAGDQALNSLCETIFEVGADDAIEQWSYRGNDCY